MQCSARLVSAPTPYPCRVIAEVYWLKNEDLDRIGLRSSWYDQLLVDRCSLNKRLEQGFYKEGRAFQFAEEAKTHIAQVSRCAYGITSVEATSNLRKLLARRQ